jgi:hypothetical protein
MVEADVRVCDPAEECLHEIINRPTGLFRQRGEVFLERRVETDGGTGHMLSILP